MAKKTNRQFYDDYLAKKQSPKKTWQLQPETQNQTQAEAKKESSFYNDYVEKKQSVQPSTVQSSSQKKTFVPVSRWSAFLTDTAERSKNTVNNALPTRTRNTFAPSTVMGRMSGTRENVFSPRSLTAAKAKSKKGNILPGISDDLAGRMRGLLSEYEGVSRNKGGNAPKHLAVHDLINRNKSIFDDYKKETGSELTIPGLAHMFENVPRQRTFVPTIVGSQEGTFRTMPSYEAARENYQTKTADDFKAKYGVDMHKFGMEELYETAKNSGVRLHVQNMNPRTAPMTNTTSSMVFVNTSDKEKKKEYERLARLALYNYNRDYVPNAIEAGEIALINELSLGYLTNNKAVDKEIFKKPDEYKYVIALKDNDKVTPGNIYANMKSEHPVATGIGEGVGDLAATALVAAVTGGVGEIPAVASAPAGVADAAKAATTFGVKRGLRAAVGGEDAGKIARETAIGALGGAAGSVAGQVTDSAIGNALKNKGMRDKIIPQIARKSLAAGSFSLADTASTYYLHPENERPTLADMAKNIGVSFAFAAITNAAEMVNVKQHSKQALNVINDSMKSEYDAMLKAAQNGNKSEVTQCAYRVLDRAESLEKLLNGEKVEVYHYNRELHPEPIATMEDASFVGEANRVKLMKEELRTIQDRVTEYLSAAGQRNAENTGDITALALRDNIPDIGSGRDVVKTGTKRDIPTSANKYAAKLQSKLDSGNKLTDRNIGQQIKKNEKAIQSENDFAAAMSNIKPTEITDRLISDSGLDLNGMASDEGVKVSRSGNQSVPVSIKHEWLHMFEKLNPEAYKTYKASVLAAARETNGAAVESRINFLKDNYDYSQSVAEDEIVAELTGGFNTKAIQRMAEGNNGLAAKLTEAMRSAKREIRQTFTDGKYTSPTGLQLAFNQLNAAEKQYIQGLAEARGNTVESGKIQNSIVQKPNGDYKVIADRDIFNGVAEADKITVLKKFLNENIRGNLYTALSDGAPLNVAQKNKTLQKLYRPGIPMYDNKYNARIKTASHYDEALEASKYDRTEAPKNNKHGQSPSSKRTVEIEIPEFDNNNKLTGSSVWEAEISVINNEDLAYDISKLKKITKDTHSDLGNLLETNPDIDRASLPSIISQQGNFVKSNNFEKVKYSIKKNQNEDVDINEIINSDRTPEEKQAILEERIKFVPRGGKTTQKNNDIEKSLSKKTRAYSEEDWGNLTENVPPDYNLTKDAKALREEIAEREDRTKLLKLAREVQKMKMSAETRESIPDIINRIDTISKGILKKGYTTADGRTVMGRIELQGLREDYRMISKTDPNFIPSKDIEAKIGRLDKMQISNMDIGMVRELIQTIQEIKHEIRTHNKMIGDEKKREISFIATDVMSEINLSKGNNYLSKGSNLMDKYITPQLTPIRMFKRLAGYKTNSALVGLAEALNDGQRKSLEFQQKATRKFDSLVSNEKEMRKFTGKKAETIDISDYVSNYVEGNKKIYITPAMRVSLYLHSKSYDNLRHIARGGIKFPDIKAYLNGNVEAAYDAGVIVKLPPSVIRSITSNMSDFEKEFANVAYSFFNHDTKQAINETSLELKGYELATTKDYFQIKADRNFTKTEIESLKRDATIEGMGILKERINASNPIMLEDVTKVISRQMKSVGDYYGLAIPLRNFNSVYHYTSPRYSSSVQETLKKKWGSGAAKYIDDLITDLQSGRNGSGNSVFDKTLSKIKGNYAQAVLAANPTVIAQQAASYPTAAAIVGWKALAQGTVHKVTQADIDFINEHTPLLWYRSRGYSTSELGDYADGTSEDWSKNGIAPKFMGLIQKVDVATVTKLYKAAEYNIRDNYPNLEEGSEEFNKKVIDLYNRVIEETQPNYTIMQRPDLLRNPNKALGMLTMFKTQIMQNWNLLYDSTNEYIAKAEAYKNWASPEREAELNEAKVYFGRVTTALIVATLVIAEMKAGGNLIKGKFKKRYSDKEGNLNTSTILSRMVKDFAETLAGTLFFGGEIINGAEMIIDKIKGNKTSNSNSMEAPVMSAVNDFSKAAAAMLDVDYGDIINDPRPFIRASNDLAQASSKLLGLPLENIENIINGTINNSIFILDKTGAVDGNEIKFAIEKAKTKMSDDNSKSFIAILKNAKQRMDETTGEKHEAAARVYEKIYNEMLAGGISEGKMLKAIEKKKPTDTDFGVDLSMPSVLNNGIPSYIEKQQKQLSKEEEDNLKEWSSNVGMNKRTGKVYFKDEDGNQYELTDKQAKHYKEAKARLTAEAKTNLVSGEKTIEEVLEGNNKFKLYADEMTDEQYEAAYNKKGQKEEDRQNFAQGKTTREVTLTGLYKDYPERIKKSILARVDTDIDKRLRNEMWEEVKANGVYYTPSSHARVKQAAQSENEIIQNRISQLSQTVADEAPEYAERYNKSVLGITPIETAKVNGREYVLNDAVSALVTQAAKQDYSKNIEALENNELKIEDIVGYKNNGKPYEMFQRNSDKVKKTGTLYNADGSDRFDAVGKAKIYYDLKANAINYAIDQYKNEITGKAEAEGKSAPGAAESSSATQVSFVPSGGGRSSGGSKGRSGGSGSRKANVSLNDIKSKSNQFAADSARFGSLGWQTGSGTQVAARSTPSLANVKKSKKFKAIEPIRMI